MLPVDFVLILVGDEGELLLTGYFLLPLAPIAYRTLQASAGWLSPRHAMPLCHESCRPTLLISMDWRLTANIVSVRFILWIDAASA
jgi:hypothetical protein